jgi:hypothetical protein
MRAIWHGYMLITLVDTKTIPLSAATRGVIRAAMAALNVPWDGKQPAQRFQARTSRDGTQAIYEITADLAANTPYTALDRIANALHVDPARLRSAIRYRYFAPGGTYQQSLREVRAYLREHAGSWEALDDD